MKIKVKTKQKKSKPIKAGSSMPKNIGGAINAKIALTVRKNRKR